MHCPHCGKCISVVFVVLEEEEEEEGLAVHFALQTPQVLLHQRVVPYTGQWPQRRPQYTGNSPSTTMALASTAIARPTVVATTILACNSIAIVLACNAAQNWHSSLQSTGKVSTREKSGDQCRKIHKWRGWVRHSCSVNNLALKKLMYIVMPTSELRYN